ncbi:dienelactone hydrolase family protein [Pseudoxanthomonas sp. LjRoot168]|uniref:dienelactone hydrolase family protein n=1 Tax=unclassified Pseudoxanthomonas TaxID=2645906 RepID=UPI003ECD2A38
MDSSRATASAFDQRLLDLYDDYVHGRVDRRGFLSGAARFAVGGTTAAALLAALAPQYAFAAQVAADDPRITTVYRTFPAPQGHGEGRGLLAMPREPGPHPVVLVVHENRGLNPYIEDVARRLAVAGFIAFAPDALYPLGGYPGNDDKGRELQATLDRAKVMADLEAAARFAQALPRGNGKLGVVGFCFGGLVTNVLAARLPELVDAGVPYYGGQPSAEEASRIRAPLLLQFAELDTRVNAGWPTYEQQLKDAGVAYTAHMYPGVNHGFHNDTTPRYDAAAAELSWQRTLAFFRKHLAGP